MPSASLRQWQTVRAASLYEIEAAHAAIGGSGRGRRYATQQVNHAYTVLLSSQFQGFCRDLHSECADALSDAMTPVVFRPAIRAEFRLHRRLDSGNPNAGNIGADFGRLGLRFWHTAQAQNRFNARRQAALEELNRWRNAIAHQDFTSVTVGGSTVLRLQQVRQWRRACDGLASSFDAVMYSHLLGVTGIAPW